MYCIESRDIQEKLDSLQFRELKIWQRSVATRANLDTGSCTFFQFHQLHFWVVCQKWFAPFRPMPYEMLSDFLKLIFLLTPATIGFLPLLEVRIDDWAASDAWLCWGAVIVTGGSPSELNVELVVEEPLFFHGEPWFFMSFCMVTPG